MGADITRWHRGEFLIPGWNVDRLDIAAGLKMAARLGYGDPQTQFVAEYALMRRARGEEEGAQQTALSGGIDLTSYFAILAAATVQGT